MKVLAIESSCDESALALMESHANGTIAVLHESISSQIDLHALYGGVVPELASREHLKNLPLLYENLVLENDVSSIDAIMVTTGPGLQGCLLMGTCFAEGLAKGLSKPLYGINHIEGHVFAGFIEKPVEFPFIALIVSGGHTEIIFVREPGSYEVLARSRDDAAGEAFDKSAYLLGFPYPGGMHLAKCADEVTSSRYSLPRVMHDAKAFSFSGLKTAIRLLVQKELGHGSEAEEAQKRREICHTVQKSIVEELVSKLLYHVQEKNCPRITISGGVAANKRLRMELKALSFLECNFPSPKHCTDNAAMIGAAALVRAQYGVLMNRSLHVNPGWRVECS